MKIDLNEVIEALKLLETKLMNEEQKFVSIEIDNYWIIGSSEWANFKSIPEPAVGSLADDLNSIKKSLNRKMIVSYSEVDSLVSILRALSEELAPTNQK